MKEETRVTDRMGAGGAEPLIELESARQTERRRRPSGAPPPLPRKLGMSGRIWILLLLALGTGGAMALTYGPFLELSNRIDGVIIRALADLRTSWLTTVMRGIKAAGSGWAVVGVGWAMVIALIILRRGRHLLVFLLSLFAIALFGGLVYDRVVRPRPYDVPILSGWGGSSFISPPVMLVTVVVLGICYTLVPPGRGRSAAKWLGGAIIMLVAFSRVYLGVDHPSDVAISMVVGVGIPLIAYRMFAPNEAFPVKYRRGKAAHLDVTGRRGEAIRQAIHDQLGLTVTDIKPVGLEGSGGSTPLLLTVAGDPDRYLFAKLYAKGHVQADRWYKIFRTILYGRLEDETPFQTVRRFVEYEDYTLRLLRSDGLPVPAPYGIVEITPESEYLIAMEYFDGAVELGDATIDNGVIDQGLEMVAKLWDAGLAHRDIKPANLMVRDGELLLIDVFFVQVRPSPWRQAVDLANMMLVLAVRSDVERVYRRALAYFTPNDIAEAFAAARGVASPTQLRAALKRDGRDLLAQFRQLAPKRRPIAIQRWSVRRVATALVLLAGCLVAGVGGAGLLLPLQDLPVTARPDCGTGPAMILMAQAVPTATRLPCIALLPSGWSFSDAQIHSGQATLWLNSDRAGRHAVEVRLERTCAAVGGTRVPSDEVGTRRFESPRTLRPGLAGDRYYLFDGGCITYRYDFAPGTPSSLLFDIDAALAMEPRVNVVTHVAEEDHADLCGAGVRCAG